MEYEYKMPLGSVSLSCFCLHVTLSLSYAPTIPALPSLFGTFVSSMSGHYVESQ